MDGLSLVLFGLLTYCPSISLLPVTDSAPSWSQEWSYEPCPDQSGNSPTQDTVIGREVGVSSKER